VADFPGERGGEGRYAQMDSKSGPDLPAWMVEHDLRNKLSVIIGNCDRLSEITEKNTEHARRLAVIHDAAESIVKELTEHQRNMEAKT